MRGGERRGEREERRRGERIYIERDWKGGRETERANKER